MSNRPVDYFEVVEYIHKGHPPVRVDTNMTVRLHKEKGSETGWVFNKHDLPHDMDVAFSHGVLLPRIYNECKECGKDHSALVEEFMDAYRQTTDGFGIIRHSELAAMRWREAGIDSTELELVASFKRGEITAVELAEGLENATAEMSDTATRGLPQTVRGSLNAEDSVAPQFNSEADQKTKARQGAKSKVPTYSPS